MAIRPRCWPARYSSSLVKNVADNGKVAFVVDDLASVQPWRPRSVHLQQQPTPQRGRESPRIRIHPERISFGIDETDTLAHSLTVSARNVG